MTTLAERCKAAGLKSAAELTRITGTSKETLTNWMTHKPALFDTVLKGATEPETPNEPTRQTFARSDEPGENSYIDFLYLKADYETLNAKYEALKAEKVKEHEPQQTWAFSQEDLQEQAKLIEKLTTENQTLKAEIQLSTKKTNGFDKFKFEGKIKKLEKKLELTEAEKHAAKELNITLLEEIEKLKIRAEND